MLLLWRTIICSLYEQTHTLVLIPNIEKLVVLIYLHMPWRFPHEASSLWFCNKLYLALQGLDRNDDIWSRRNTIRGRLVVVCAFRSGISVQIFLLWLDRRLFFASSHEWETAPAGLYSFHPETETFENILELDGKISSISASEDSIALIFLSISFLFYTLFRWRRMELKPILNIFRYQNQSKLRVGYCALGMARSNQKNRVLLLDNHCQELDPKLLTQPSPNSLTLTE